MRLFNERKKNQSLLKYLLSELHKWLGLFSGLIAFVVCLTGSIYIFKSPVSRMVNKEVIEVIPAQTTFPVSEIIATYKKAYAIEPSSIMIPEKKDEAIIISAFDRKNNQRLSVYMNPYTGEVMGEGNTSTDNFFRFILQSHRWLLITGGVGKTIVGITIIIFSVMLITGLVMWLPKSKNVRKAFTIKLKSKFFRLNYDLHRVGGFYSFFILLLIALTGLYFSFPWYRNGILTLMGKKNQKHEISQKRPSEGKAEKNTLSGKKENKHTPFSWDSLLKEVETHFPYQSDLLVRMPRGKSSVLSIRKYNDNNMLGVRMPDQLLYDLHTNQVTDIQQFSKSPLYKQFQGLVLPIHTGEIFGWPSMVLYFFIALTGCSLPVTGTIIWYKRNF